MKRKVILFLALFCCQTVTYGYVNFDADEPDVNGSENHVQPILFYVGLLGGIEQMTGKRSDIFTQNGVNAIFGQNNGMQQNRGAASLLAGFLWKFPPLCLWMGPELYFGKGNTLSNTSSANVSSPSGNIRFYSADFERRFFYGGRIRVGFPFWESYLFSVAVGMDRSLFLTKGSIQIDPATQPTITERRGHFNGVSFGVGFDKHFTHIVIGLDFKMIQYRRQVNITFPAGGGSVVLSARPIIYSAALKVAYQF